MNSAAALPLVVIMVVALALTTWPTLPERGVWAAAHESRTDWSILLGSVCLSIDGAGHGRWTVVSRVDAAAAHDDVSCAPAGVLALGTAAGVALRS